MVPGCHVRTRVRHSRQEWTEKKSPFSDCHENGARGMDGVFSTLMDREAALAALMCLVGILSWRPAPGTYRTTYRETDGGLLAKKGEANVHW